MSWSKTEIEFLRENYGYNTNVHLSEIMGKSVSNLKSAARRYINDLSSTGKSQNSRRFNKVYGIGYIRDPLSFNESTFDMSVYVRWKHMIERVYGEKELTKHPTYVGCSVVEAWHCFEEFYLWATTQKGFRDRDFHLDKDILLKGNKVYSPNTCCFVPIQVNMFLCKTLKSRGNLLIGVTKFRDKYRACCSDGCGKNIHLGLFEYEKGAFLAYKTYKECLSKILAEQHKENVTEPVYIALLNYEVAITD